MKTFKKISGICIKEIINLESIFLKKINYRLFIEDEKFIIH